MTKSFTYGELPEAPPTAILEELRGYEVAWLSDAMEMYLMDPEIRPVFPGAARVAGPAVTVSVPPGDFVMVSAALREARPGDVLVVDARGDRSRAVWGDYFSAWAQGIGVQGMVIDGATRDAGGIGELGFPVFARSVIARKPSLNGHGEVNVPISCGGVCVVPGDIVVADAEGVIVLPLRHLDEILERVRAIAVRERTHNGVPMGGKAEYDAYFDMAFAKRVAAANGLKPANSE
jgi:4-hydroxy-4-methyl-2-oxoglutarate aldolase